jgi:hypothetical protein
LPGIDALNHARGSPVSWVVSYPGPANPEINSPNISLITHRPTAQGEEILNNYGAKPNSELILGYGFSLKNNPDDTIILKVGGIDGKRWEVGRSAQGVEGLWDEILNSMRGDPDSASSYEDQLDAAAALSEMVQTMVDRLPREKDYRSANLRPEVLLMLHHYVEGRRTCVLKALVCSDISSEGQQDILQALSMFAEEKEQAAIEAARAEGIDIVLED